MTPPRVEFDTVRVGGIQQSRGRPRVLPLEEVERVCLQRRVGQQHRRERVAAVHAYFTIRLYVRLTDELYHPSHLKLPEISGLEGGRRLLGVHVGVEQIPRRKYCR